MTQHDNTPASLVFVAESSLAELRTHLAHLDTAPAKVVPTLLKQIESVSTVLSQSLKALSVYTDTLTPDVEPSDGDEERPDADRGVLLAIERMTHAIERGFCPRCGGIRPPRGHL